MGRGYVVVLGCAIAAPVATAAPSAPTLPTPPFDVGAIGTAAIHVEWPGVIGAVRYRVTWNGGGVSNTPRPSFDLAGVAPGHYELAVAAIDASGGESAPGAPLAIDVIAVRATPPGADAPAPPTRGAFAIDTRFSAPGFRCQLDDGPAGDEVVATEAGAQILRCVAGPRVFDTRVVIAPVIVATVAPPLARGATTVVHVTVATVGAIGDKLDVEAIGEIGLGEAQRTELGFDVPVTVEASARSAGLTISGNGVELGRVALELVDPPPPPLVIASTPAWWALDVGGEAGGIALPSDGNSATALGHQRTPADAITSGALFGPLLGFFPTRRVGLELEPSLITGGYAAGGGVAPVLSTRAQLAVRAIDVGRFGLRIVGGAGAMATLRDRGTSRAVATGEFHAGVALTVEARANLWIRVEAVDVITVSHDGGSAQCGELDLGLVTRLGRHDRW